jgi:glycosyltransferase involved in cell wall biosynthesis
MTLKVVEVLECGGPGGTGNQVAALCNALPRDSFDVVLAYGTRPGCSPEQFRAQASGARKAVHMPELTREISLASDARALAKLISLFREERPDVVHAHSSKAGVLARLAAWITGVPRVFYTPHGYSFLQKDRSALERWFYRMVELAVSWIGTVVAVSPSEAALARSLTWGKPVEVVQDPFLGDWPAPKARNGRKPLIVGACGRLTAARQPDAFIKLAQRVTDSRNDVACVWIGGGELEDSMRRHIENMNLAGRLEVTGWLDAKEAQSRLRDCDIVVHYSAWDGLPNAVVEAMTHGLPVVASDIPGCRDAVVDGETGFVARDEVALLERTLELIDKPGLREQFGAAARARAAELFDAAKAWKRVEALYQDARG